MDVFLIENEETHDSISFINLFTIIYKKEYDIVIAIGEKRKLG